MENIELINKRTEKIFKRLVKQVGKHVESLEAIGARDVCVLNAKKAYQFHSAVGQLQALVKQLKERGNS